MGSLKSLAKGMLLAAGLVWIINIIALIRGGDEWLGLTYLLVLLIPVTTIAILKQKTPKNAQLNRSVNLRDLLFTCQGAAIGFWMFDLFTTFYAIDVTGLSIELNPLGWPLGILGALAFYGPALASSYALLYKIKEPFALYAAAILAFVTLAMGTMNLFAGANNFQVFIYTVDLNFTIRYPLVAALVTLNLVVPLILNRVISQHSGLVIKRA